MGEWEGEGGMEEERKRGREGEKRWRLREKYLNATCLNLVNNLSL